MGGGSARCKGYGCGPISPSTAFILPRQATPHTGPALIAAPWPAAHAPVDAAATEQFEALQAAVRAVRNARAEYGVEMGRKIAAVVRCASRLLGLKGGGAVGCAWGGVGGQAERGVEMGCSVAATARCALGRCGHACVQDVFSCVVSEEGTPAA